MISLVIVVLYAIGHISLNATNARSALHIPDIALWCAVLSALFSLGILLFRREHPSYVIGLIAYLLTATTSGTLIELTGAIDSPFVALWLMVGVFAGLFGGWVWFAIFGAANLHVVYQLFFAGQGLEAEHIIKLLLVAEAPLIASFITWHAETRGQATKNEKAYSALAAQLTQVANKSDIVINSIADCVVAIDSQGIVQLINPAAQNSLGWPRQDAIGLDYRSVIKLIDANNEPIPDDISPVKQVLISNKLYTNNNLSVLTKSGKKVQISLAVTPVSDQARANGVIAVFRDVTREKEEERQRGEFISTASHEMRTPVAAMEGYLALAMNPQTATIDDKARAYLQKAYESTQHLGRLFQDLLTVSKAEDGRLMPRPAVLDALTFAHEIVDSLSTKAKAKGIGLVFIPGATDQSKRLRPAYYTYADPSQMREVLSNIIDNAIKYTKQGTVTVDISGDDSMVAFSVTDTGIGIPPEDVPHLFQKFYRVDNSDTREIGGTGLGLYISRRLSEANNGHLELKSIYGKGSTFTLKLPRIANDKAAEMMNKVTEQSQPAIQL